MHACIVKYVVFGGLATRALGVFEVGSILFGGGLIYNAFKEEDQTMAIIKGLAGVALGGLGLYSYVS